MYTTAVPLSSKDKCRVVCSSVEKFKQVYRSVSFCRVVHSRVIKRKTKKKKVHFGFKAKHLHMCGIYVDTSFVSLHTQLHSSIC